MIDLKDKKILSEFKKNVKKNLKEYYTKNCYDEYGWEKPTHIPKSDLAKKLYSMYEIVFDGVSDIINKNTIYSIETKNIFYIGQYHNRGDSLTEIKYVKYPEMINSILKLYGSEKRIVSSRFRERFFNSDFQYLMFVVANKK